MHKPQVGIIWQLTNTNIAASKTLIGNPELGGVDGLEFQIGSVKTAPISIAEYSEVLAPAIGTTTFDGNTGLLVANQPSGTSGTVDYYTFTAFSSTSNVSITNAGGNVNLIAFGGGLWSEGRFASDDGSEFQLDSFNFSVTLSSFVGHGSPRVKKFFHGETATPEAETEIFIEG